MAETDGKNGNRPHRRQRGGDCAPANGTDGKSEMVPRCWKAAKRCANARPEELKALQSARKDRPLEIGPAREARRNAAQPRPGRALQRLPAPASRQNQSRRGGLQLYLGHGRHDVLRLHHAGVHRHAADVLLPPLEGRGFPRHPVSRTRCPLRQTAAEHAPLGRSPDGHHGGAPHVPCLSHGFV